MGQEPSGPSAAVWGQLPIQRDVHGSSGSVSPCCWLLQVVPLVVKESDSDSRARKQWTRELDISTYLQLQIIQDQWTAPDPSCSQSCSSVSSLDAVLGVKRQVKGGASQNQSKEEAWCSVLQFWEWWFSLPRYLMRLDALDVAGEVKVKVEFVKVLAFVLVLPMLSSWFFVTLGGLLLFFFFHCWLRHRRLEGHEAVLTSDKNRKYSIQQ